MSVVKARLASHFPAQSVSADVDRAAAGGDSGCRQMVGERPGTSVPLDAHSAVSTRAPAVDLLGPKNLQSRRTGYQPGLHYGEPTGGADPGSEGGMHVIDVQWAQRRVLPSEPCQFVAGKHSRCSN